MHCNAGKHIQHAVTLLTFAKTKKKTCLALRAAVRTRIILCCTLLQLLQSKLQMSYELLSSFYRNGVYFLLLRRDAATQRRRHLRIVSCMLLQLHFAHSHFVLLIVQARKK